VYNALVDGFLKSASDASDVEEIVKEVIAQHFRVKGRQITRETSFNDLGATDLDMAELLIELENAFEDTIPDWDEKKIRTVGDAIKHVAYRGWVGFPRKR
jgi:acyl carrier protein